MLIDFSENRKDFFWMVIFAPISGTFLDLMHDKDPLSTSTWIGIIMILVATIGTGISHWFNVRKEASREQMRKMTNNF
jgi:threonine/homoserine efflux transporter RhtA